MSEVESPAAAQAVTVVVGDGVGPEISSATQRVLKVVCPDLEFIAADAGEKVFKKGEKSGVPQETLDLITKTGVLLKAPLATPIGKGEKSANVTLRKALELYANIRPVKQLPNVRTAYSDYDIDFIVVRENVEDLYAGIEHMQTPDVAQCLKLITRKGSEKINRLALALARAEGRPSVHCATKANIMKLSEGLFKTVFEEVAKDYPEIEAHHILIDNCAHQMVINPEQFDIIVTTNMNGDIISDLSAGLVGGLGLAPGANMGAEAAAFEPVHGTAPDIAGQDKVNPTAMMLSAVMMLRHLGRAAAADAMEAAITKVYAEGVNLTGDVAAKSEPVGTAAFTDAVLAAIDTPSMEARETASRFVPPANRLPVLAPKERGFDGMDIFVEFDGDVASLAEKLKAAATDTGFDLLMISNRGAAMYPNPGPLTDTVPHWRCRFQWRGGAEDQAANLALIGKIAQDLRWMHVEKLIRLDGVAGYSLAQGQS